MSKEHLIPGSAPHNANFYPFAGPKMTPSFPGYPYGLYQKRKKNPRKRRKVQGYKLADIDVRALRGIRWKKPGL